MTPETRAVLDAARAACTAAAARFRERDRLMAQIWDLRAQLIEAERDIHLKMTEAYREGFTDGMEFQKEQG